jgi:hypothetical protein
MIASGNLKVTGHASYRRIMEPKTIDDCDGTNCKACDSNPNKTGRKFVSRMECPRRQELLAASGVVKVPRILQTKWDFESQEKIEASVIYVGGRRFFTFAAFGNLLFTPEEIEIARTRFRSWPDPLTLDQIQDGVSGTLVAEGFIDCGFHQGLPGSDEQIKHFLRDNRELITLISTSQPDQDTVESLKGDDEL